MDYRFIFYSFNFLKDFMETIHASYKKESSCLDGAQKASATYSLK